METESRVAGKRLVLDLRDVTYADASAAQLLREIYEQTNAQVVAGTVWTQSLAEYIKRGDSQIVSSEEN